MIFRDVRHLSINIRILTSAIYIFEWNSFDANLQLLLPAGLFGWGGPLNVMRFRLSVSGQNFTSGKVLKFGLILHKLSLTLLKIWKGIENISEKFKLFAETFQCSWHCGEKRIIIIYDYIGCSRRASRVLSKFCNF